MAQEHLAQELLAQEKIVIDLDDGMNVNYVKSGAALEKIPGLEVKEE